MAFTREKSHLVTSQVSVLKHGTKFSVGSIEEEQGIGLIAELKMIGGRLLSWAGRRTDLMSMVRTLN